MKFGRQMHGVATPFQNELRGIGCAIHLDMLQNSMVIARGRKNAADALENSQIGVSKGIVSGDRRSSRVVLLPGTEAAARLNESRRLCICQPRAKCHRLSGSH